MYSYELRRWLAKYDISDENVDMLVELVTTFREKDDRHDFHIAYELLLASIEVMHLWNGRDSLLEYAEELRSWANSIEYRVKKNEFKVVSTIGEPPNDR